MRMKPHQSKQNRLRLNLAMIRRKFTNPELHPKEHRIHSPNQTPQLLRPTHKRWAPKISGFEKKNYNKPKKKRKENQLGLIQSQDPKGCSKWLLKGSHWSHSPFTRAQKAAAIWKAPKPYVKEIHVLIWKLQPEGQGKAGILSRTKAGGSHFHLLFFSFSSLLSRCHLHTLHLLCSGVPKEILQASGVPVFTSDVPICRDAIQGMPLDFLAPEARGACILGPTGL